MDFAYDGQLRRYISQFMRIFIGFKYETLDKEQKVVPVLYGDMSRQVASIIKENSENKMPNVPRMGCYVTDLALDPKRLSDSSFVSKVNIRERKFEETAEGREYHNYQGGNYTVERLMPTPFKLSMKADLWTSNTEQKLQLIEQMLILFNPSLEIQTTDNYLDWTSLSVVDLTDIRYSSKNIPQGVDSTIDICTMSFEMPIWISPPAKVKKLGIIQSVISNVFTESGDVAKIEDYSFNRMDEKFGLAQSSDPQGFSISSYSMSVLLMKSPFMNTEDYEVTIINPEKLIVPLITSNVKDPNGKPEGADWKKLIDVLGGAKPGSRISFKQPNNHELVGTFVINPLDASKLNVTFDIDTLPSNSYFDIDGNPSGQTPLGEMYTAPGYDPSSAKQYVDMIINPRTFNPIINFGGLNNIPYNYRLMILEDIGDDKNTDGADAWAYYTNLISPDDSNKVSDLVAKANSIIAWNGVKWVIVFYPDKEYPIVPITQNMKTLMKYKCVAGYWVKAFEGEYQEGEWTLLLNQ